MTSTRLKRPVSQAAKPWQTEMVRLHRNAFMRPDNVSASVTVFFFFLLKMMHAAQLSNAQPGSDASVAKGFAFLERIQFGKEMLVRIVAKLTKLVLRFDPDQYQVRESTSGLPPPFEHEDDL